MDLKVGDIVHVRAEVIELGPSDYVQVRLNNYLGIFVTTVTKSEIVHVEPRKLKVGDYIDLTTPMGRGFMAMMSALAEDERQRIIKRTHEGRKIARAKGVKMGRRPILTPHQIKEARHRIAEGETTRDLAKSYHVSVSTISRFSSHV
jgi:hypothetical protein